MNRQKEYENLLIELGQTPPALNDVITRAQKRAKKSKALRNFFIKPISGIAAVFIAFAAMVNLLPNIAFAVERIPGLRQIAAAVSFSPSLTTAIEHEFIQHIGLEQTINNITMRIEYVIVDQRQLNIFYTLDSPIYSSMDASPTISNPDGSLAKGWASSVSWGGVRENRAVRHLSANSNLDIPDKLLFTAHIRDSGAPPPNSSATPSPPMPMPTPPPYQHPSLQEPEIIATFTFLLEFDPTFTSQGEIIHLDYQFTIDGQTLTVTTVEIFPTNMRVNFEASPYNTASLQELQFHFQNERGRQFHPPTNGIVATGTSDSRMMSSHRLESAFFAQSSSLTMFIESVKWLDHDMERVRIDLPNQTADRLPEGVTIGSILQNRYNENTWHLTFTVEETRENHSFSPFSNVYYDEAGNQHSLNTWSSGMRGYVDEATGRFVDTPGIFRMEFSIFDFPYDIVYLTPTFSRHVQLQTPTEIPIIQ